MREISIRRGGKLPARRCGLWRMVDVATHLAESNFAIHQAKLYVPWPRPTGSSQVLSINQSKTVVSGVSEKVAYGIT